MSPYSDQYIKAEPLKLFVGIRGAVGDMRGLRNHRPPWCQGKLEGLAASQDGMDSVVFLRHFHSFHPNNFQDFRAQRNAHKDLTKNLYKQWKDVGFGTLDTKTI
jgi:hypothetical protein